MRLRRVLPWSAAAAAVAAIAALGWTAHLYRMKYKTSRAKHKALRTDRGRLEAEAADLRSRLVKKSDKVLYTEGDYSRYFLTFQVAYPDTSLPKLKFVSPPRRGAVVRDLHPLIRVAPVDRQALAASFTKGVAELNTIYYFELDTSKDFDSPNLVRMPLLLPLTLSEDLDSPRGRYYSMTRSQHRSDIGGGPRVKLPFRAFLLRLPRDRAKLNKEELQKQAVALGLGLSREEAVRETFSYVRQTYSWASDTWMRKPLDTFKRGLGECGHVNGLLAAFLEYQGLRCRGVAGYCPRLEPIYPDRGHSALEVHLDGKWRYVDPYYDVPLCRHSAREIGQKNLGPRVLVFKVEKQFDHAVYGDAVYLQDQFDRRTYLDYMGRKGMVKGEKLDARESNYGLDWKLPKLSRNYGVDEVIPDELKIHCRARYVIGPGIRLAPVTEQPKSFRGARVSPWSRTHFVVDLRETKGKLKDRAAAGGKK